MQCARKNLSAFPGVFLAPCHGMNVHEKQNAADGRKQPWCSSSDGNFLAAPHKKRSSTVNDTKIGLP